MMLSRLVFLMKSFYAIFGVFQSNFDNSMKKFARLNDSIIPPMVEDF